MTDKIYTSFDLLTLGLLPTDWIEQINRVATKYAVYTQLDGTSSTSREPEGSEKVDVYVVMGDSIKEHLLWLHELYANQLCGLATKVAGQQVYPSKDLKSGMNINVLRGKGARYEWHVDSNPLTGILYVTTHLPGEGGELVFEKENNRTAIHPKSGIFIAFDAREIPHTVFPLNQESVRISIPMNYYQSQDEQSRPTNLDSYLYETSI